MTVIIEYTRTGFTLVFVNPGETSHKIWEFHNSWGWNTLTWRLMESGDRSNFIEIKKLSKKAWTKNGPTYFELTKGSRSEIPINLMDGDWEIPDAVNKLKSKVIIVKLILDIPVSPEAEMNKVFVGKLETNEILLYPPHHWLPVK